MAGVGIVIVPRDMEERVRVKADSLVLHAWQCRQLEDDVHSAWVATQRLRSAVPSSTARAWTSTHRAGNAAAHDRLFSSLASGVEHARGDGESWSSCPQGASDGAPQQAGTSAPPILDDGAAVLDAVLADPQPQAAPMSAPSTHPPLAAPRGAARHL